jgi:spermidine/putrescine transport system ATP-binding protein
MSDRIGVMSAGRLLQVGPPREIYNHPVNRFVADFIGETNFIPAEVKDGIATIADNIALTVEKTAPEGVHTLAVRPEHVRLVTGEAGAQLMATVGETIYFGTDSHVHLRLSDGTEIVARQQSDASGDGTLPPGSRVGVAFAPGAVQVLED